MSAAVTIYTTAVCPYCVRAKSLLRSKGIPFREIDVERRPELREWLIARSKQRTVPQIFVNGAPLGGFTDIAALDQQGKLDPLLARDPEESDPQVLD
ncbi:MAG: glutaredoxin 3 [Polyangiaceae bacterium]